MLLNLLYAVLLGAAAKAAVLPSTNSTQELEERYTSWVGGFNLLRDIGSNTCVGGPWGSNGVMWLDTGHISNCQTNKPIAYIYSDPSCAKQYRITGMNSWEDNGYHGPVDSLVTKECVKPAPASSVYVYWDESRGFPQHDTNKA